MPLYFLLFADQAGGTGVLIYDSNEITFLRAILRLYSSAAVTRTYSILALPRPLNAAGLARSYATPAIARAYLVVVPRKEEPTLDYTVRSQQWIMSDEINRPVICDVAAQLENGETLTGVTATVMQYPSAGGSGTDVTGTLLQGSPGYSGTVVSCNIGNANALPGYYYLVRFKMTTSNTRTFSVIFQQIQCYD